MAHRTIVSLPFFPNSGSYIQQYLFLAGWGVNWVDPLPSCTILWLKHVHSLSLHFWLSTLKSILFFRHITKNNVLAVYNKVYMMNTISSKCFSPLQKIQNWNTAKKYSCQLIISAIPSSHRTIYDRRLPWFAFDSCQWCLGSLEWQSRCFFSCQNYT